MTVCFFFLSSFAAPTKVRPSAIPRILRIKCSTYLDLAMKFRNFCFRNGLRFFLFSRIVIFGLCVCVGGVTVDGLAFEIPGTELGKVLTDFKL